MDIKGSLKFTQILMLSSPIKNVNNLMRKEESKELEVIKSNLTKLQYIIPEQILCLKCILSQAW